MLIKDQDGATVVTLGDTEFVGGYLVKDYDEGQRTFRRESTYASRVDGEYDVSWSLNRVRLTLVLEIDGATRDEIRDRRDALLAAVEVPNWILDVGDGVLWRCAVADSISPRRNAAPNTLSREVTLTIPAQPRYGY